MEKGTTRFDRALAWLKNQWWFVWCALSVTGLAALAAAIAHIHTLGSALDGLSRRKELNADTVPRTSVTWEEFATQVGGSSTLTHLQRSRFIDRQQGKRAKWTVKVGDVKADSHSGELTLAFQYGPAGPSGLAHFPAASEGELAALRPGDIVKVAGVIYVCGRAEPVPPHVVCGNDLVHLLDGELVDVIGELDDGKGLDAPRLTR